MARDFQLAERIQMGIGRHGNRGERDEWEKAVVGRRRDFETGAVIVIAGLTLIPATAASVLEDGFSAAQMMRPVSLAAFLGGVTLTIASVLVVAAGGDIKMLALSYASGPTVNLLALWFWASCHGLRPTFEGRWRMFPGMLRESSPFFAEEHR